MKPTLYKPEHCEQLIEHMAKGYSFESFAGVVRVSRSALYNWCDADHSAYQPDFAEAKQIAQSCCLLWWETQGIEGLYARTIREVIDGKTKETQLSAANTGIWALNMRNRFGWKDKIADVPADLKPQRLIIKMDDSE